MTVVIDPADMSDLTPILAGIPSGTARQRQVVELPAGEYEHDPDLTLSVEGKRFWSIVGGPTILHWATYGQPSPDGVYERRHSLFKGMADFYLGGLHIRGPHTVRDLGDPTKADWNANKPFQHAFSIGDSRRVMVEDVSAYEIAGDGLYLNDVEDLQVVGLRVEFNGRQGIAGIDGDRWLFEQVHIVNASRHAVDLEPLGSTRWVTGVKIRNSDLKGGIVLHRVSQVVLEHNLLRQGAIILKGDSIAASQRRHGIRILNNVWPDLYWSKSKDAAPIQVNSVNGLEVRGNKCHRDPADLHTRNAVFVEIRSLPQTGHFTVQGNDLKDFAAPIRWKVPKPVSTTEDVQTVLRA
jgi:hypothetical protein